MANRAVDLVITYRVVKMLVTPFERQEAFKYGIIDKDGKVLKKYTSLQKREEKNAYTQLHRFVFNLKRILKKVGLGGRLGSFAVALGLLLRENKEYVPHKKLIESTIISYLKETKQYDNLLNEQGDVKSIYKQDPYMTCFGIDVYEKDGELYPEDKYETI
mgnify:CR=1 FL=1|tara:strand:+ start:2236 stop:2715 length:480 start_codon:yes stop_codon:yes gene_type:complete